MQAPKKHNGYPRLPGWLKEAYIKSVKGRCQQCGTDKNLVVHRIIRGNSGGLYIPQNCIVLCRECHMKMHSGEFR